MAMPLPSSSPAPGIDTSKTDSKPWNRYDNKQDEVGISKPGYVVPPDEGANNPKPKGGNNPLSRIWDYFFRLATGAHAERRFILDSGASVHTTAIAELLQDFIQASSAATVLDASNRRHLRTEGVGSLACHGFSIPNVRYVTGLAPGRTLVSVQQLAGCGYLVLFGGGRCYVKNRKDGSLVGKGRLQEDDGSYHLEYLHIPLDAHKGSN